MIAKRLDKNTILIGDVTFKKDGSGFYLAFDQFCEQRHVDRLRLFLATEEMSCRCDLSELELTAHESAIMIPICLN